MKIPLFRITLLAICGMAGSLRATVPAGFSETAVATGLTVPSALDIAPDGRIFVAQQNGVIRVIQNDVLLPTAFATIPLNSDGERGMLGIVLDPNFATNHYIYVYYTASLPAPHNRLSRLTESNNQMVSNSELIMLDLPDLGSAIWHMGGSLQFGPDGKLYISAGDHQNPANSQSLGSLQGKILRLNSDGSIPADNPFYNQLAGVYRAIWAYGLRNPFTTAFQPGTGRFFLNEVGESDWEEIDDGIAGANYGWPTTEGAFIQTSFPGFTEPLFSYAHSDGCAITGGAFYNPIVNQFGASYTGKYFFEDYCDGWIHVMDPVTKAVSEFATNLPTPINMKISANGALYFLARGVGTGQGDPTGLGSVWKIANPMNQAPAISVHPQSQIIANGAPVTFTVSASGSLPLQYQWQRNSVDIQGATASSYTFNVAPSDSGAQFRVKVSNNVGMATSNQATLTVPPGGPPVPVISTPLAGTFYNAGDTISFSGSASDPDQGALPASTLTWQVDFQHDTHAHPFIPATSGISGGSFVIPTDGEKSDNVWYRIYLTATDATGLKTTVQREIFPHKAVMTLATNAVGLNIQLDGQPKGTPNSVLGVVGIVRTLEAYAQSLGAVTYDFDNWSDGGAALHAISFPANDTTYAAQFQVIKNLSDLSWVGTPVNGWGPVEKDMSNGDMAAGDGNTITLRGVTYPKGLGCHANSTINYNLNGRYTRFISDVGVDDETLGAGSVVFQVFTDNNVKLFDSGVVTGTSPVQTVNVNVVGKSTLQLVVTDAGNGNAADHADWAGARLTQPLVTIGATDPNASEMGDTGTFTVVRSGSTASPLPVTYTVTGNATNGTDYTALNGTLTIPAGAISAPITVTPIGDTLSEGPEQVIVTLTSNASSTYFLGAPTSATVTIADKPFDSWKFSKFGANANNSQIACDTCDPVNSGLSNLLKYALNIDPMSSALSGAPAVDRTAGRLRMQFTRDTTAVDLKYEVQASSDMANWTTIATSLNGAFPTGSAFSISETTGTYRTVTVIDNAPANAPKRFIRLKVTRTQ